MENQKHFEIQITFGSHSLEYKCTTASEAYDCISDVVSEERSFSKDIKEWAIKAVVLMQHSDKLASSYRNIRIQYLPGEV